MDAQQLAIAWHRSLFGVENAPSSRTATAEAVSLTLFKRRLYRRYVHSDHLEALDRHLEQVTEFVESKGQRGIGRLIIAMPPRHGKTLTASRLYPAWHIGRNPWHRAMLVSYGQSLANKNSRVARNMLRSQVYRSIFPYVRLAADSQNVMEWDIADTEGEGGASAIGIGGAATGKGAHVLLIDDPIKNRAEAESQTYRNRIWDSYTDDLLTRLEPGGAVVVMATRWHEDDLTGRLLKRQSDRWTVLNLPAMAVENDPLGREPGAALWPERYPLAVLEEKRDSLGPYSWAALYQQDPRPVEGGILKKHWFEPRVRTIPETVRAVRYWDLAMSEKTTADYTAGLRLELAKNDEHYITDVARARVELHELPRFIKDVIIADGPDVVQGFEQTGYMTRAIQALAKDRELSQFVLKGYRVHTDKLTRVLPAAARAALGVVHVADRLFADAMLEEFASFPNGAHDDQVDAFSGAWEMINEEPRKPISSGTVKYA